MPLQYIKFNPRNTKMILLLHHNQLHANININYVIYPNHTISKRSPSSLYTSNSTSTVFYISVSFTSFIPQECPLRVTHLRPLPLKVNRDRLAIEERGVDRREVRILKQLSLLQTLLSQLLVRLPVALRGLRLLSVLGGVVGHLHTADLQNHNKHWGSTVKCVEERAWINAAARADLQARQVVNVTPVNDRNRFGWKQPHLRVYTRRDLLRTWTHWNGTDGVQLGMRDWRGLTKEETLQKYIYKY